MSKIIKKINTFGVNESSTNRTVSLRYDGITQLTTLILAPNFWDSVLSLFRSPDTFLSSIFWYPFNTRGDNTAGKLNVLNYESDVSAYDTYVLSPLFNMGRYKIPLNRANYWSYNGFSQIQAYLPLCGMVDIPLNDVLSVAGSDYGGDKPIYLYFRLGVDYRTGQGCYYIFTSTNYIENMIPIYDGKTVEISNSGDSFFDFYLTSKTETNSGNVLLKGVDVKYEVNGINYEKTFSMTQIGEDNSWISGSTQSSFRLDNYLSLQVETSKSNDSVFYASIDSETGEYSNGRLSLSKPGVTKITINGPKIKSISLSYGYNLYASQDIIFGYGENQYATKDYLYDNMVLVGTYQCQVGYPIPIPTSNTTDLYRNLLMGAVKSTVGALGSVGTLASPSSTYGSTSTTTYKSSTVGRSKSKGSRVKLLEETASTMTKIESGTEAKERAVKSKVFSTLDTASTTLSSLYSAGNIERISNSSLFGYTTDKIVVYVRTPIFNSSSFINPNGSAKKNAKIFGLPYGLTVPLNTVHGYTTVSEVHLDNTPTGIISEERELIEKLLGAGVFLP